MTATFLNFSQFRGGTSQYHRHWLGILYTDGVKYVAEEAGAYWLLDAIASYQPQLRGTIDQTWILSVPQASQRVELRYPFIQPQADADAVLTGWNSYQSVPKEKQSPIVRQEIPFTDFPMQEIVLRLVDSVLCLAIEN